MDEVSISRILDRIDGLEMLVKNTEMLVKTELKSLIEVQQRLIHERLGAPIPPPPQSPDQKKTNPPEQNKSYTPKITISYVEGSDESMISIKGNTFNYRDAIKKSGQANWNGNDKSWSMAVDCLHDLVENFEAKGLKKDVDFLLNVELPAKSSPPEEQDSEPDFDDNFPDDYEPGGISWA